MKTVKEVTKQETKVAFNTEIKNAVIEYVQADLTSLKAKNKMADVLIANKVKSVDIIALDDDEAPDNLQEFRENLVASIKAGFDDNARHILNSEDKVLNNTDRAMKSILRTQVRDSYNNIKKALIRRENNAGKTEKSKPRRDRALIAELLTKAVEKSRKTKDTWDNMVTDIKVLSEIALRINAK